MNVATSGDDSLRTSPVAFLPLPRPTVDRGAWGREGSLARRRARPRRVLRGGSRSANSADLIEPSKAELKLAAKARKLRQKLESYHGKQDARAVDFTWPHLASDDRFIRYAARIAIEWQPVEQWKDRALAETNPQAGLEALMAISDMAGDRAGLTLVAPEETRALNTRFTVSANAQDAYLRGHPVPSIVAMYPRTRLNKPTRVYEDPMRRNIHQIFLKTFSLCDRQISPH